MNKALSVAQGMEAAAIKSKELHANKSRPRSPGSVMVVYNSPSAPARFRPCGRCGHGNHDPGTGHFHTATCHKCSKVGHIYRACLSP